jgi:hypothetical protein
MALTALATTATAVRAQTDYYNTDAGRPISVEDANPLERRAFELQLAPLRLERMTGGRYTWAVEPEIAFGILPRTQVELALPLAYVDAPTGRLLGLAGIELSALHAFNMETSIPALAVAVDLLLPAGGLAPSRVYPSIKGIATRTLSWARFHVNAQVTGGSAPDVGDASVADLSRWAAGIAVDRAFPLRSLLATAELTTLRPMHAGEPLEWSVATGMRYQYTPRWAIDAGLGKRVTGPDGSWYATAGGAYAFGLPWRR